MNSKNYSFPEIFKKLHNNELFPVEMNYLIEKSFLISYSFLNTKYKDELKIITGRNNTPEDIALHSIQALFVKNNSGQYGIKRILDKWHCSLDNIADADYFLSTIIWQRVDQTVTEILKEKDPVFEKTLYKLNSLIRKSDLTKKRYFGLEYIIKNSGYTISGPVIKKEEFYKIPEDYFRSEEIEFFDKLFEYLKSITIYEEAIPLNLLVKRIQEYESALILFPHFEIPDHNNPI